MGHQRIQKTAWETTPACSGGHSLAVSDSCSCTPPPRRQQSCPPVNHHPHFLGFAVTIVTKGTHKGRPDVI